MGQGSREEHSRSEGWSDQGFAPVAEIIRVVAGLVFPPNRQPSAEAAMRRVMSASHLAEPPDLARAISTPGDTRDALLAELTIGESYFFRDWGPLAFLEENVFAQMKPRSDALRIWSAGCSTGEEPHSLAIRLRELGFAGTSAIMGTDIARPRLDVARRGRYTKWALRGVSEERVQTWFAKRGTQFLLRPDVRASVSFKALNLADEDYTSITGGNGTFDLILCRNVLIYFELDTVTAIAKRLLATLKRDGWLVLGASDPPLIDLVKCQAIFTSAGVIYRRHDAPKLSSFEHTIGLSAADVAKHNEFAPFNPAVASVGGGFSNFSGNTPLSRAPESSAPSTLMGSADIPLGRTSLEVAAAPHSAMPARASGAGDSASADIASIRMFANQGKLAEAGERSSAALEVHSMEPELHYLQGMLLLEGGHMAASVAAARRALYLDRTLVMGYMLLGDALARSNQNSPARRAFTNALSQLDVLHDDTVVPAGDGVSVNRLRQIARERIRLLGPA